MTDLLHITMIGDENVGKTFILKQYLDLMSVNPCEYQPTVFEKYKTGIYVHREKFILQLWDTPGQDEYSKLRSLVYKLTDCFIMCYSVDNPKSYQNILDKWAPELKRFKLKTPIIVVGTKIDLRSDANINCYSEENGLLLQKSIKACKYVECSSISKLGLDSIFLEAVNVILKKRMKNDKCSIS